MKENSSKFFPSNEGGGANWKGHDELKAGIAVPLPPSPDEDPDLEFLLHLRAAL